MSSYTINRISSNEIKAIGHYTGYVCIILALFMLIPIICAIFYHDKTKYLNSFLIDAIICFIFGSILFFKLRRLKLSNLSLRGSLIFVTSIWFVVTFFTALPFWFSGDLTFVDSIFEAMSGITTTGFSIYPSTYPMIFSIAIWKSLIQWLGGIGIILLLLAIIPSSISLKRLYIAEGRTEQITPNIKHTTAIFIKLYLILTLLGIVLYLFCGLPLFESICYTFTAIATGGFSINPASVHYFQTPLIQFVTIILMLLGSTNFLIHYRVIKGNFKQFYKDIEIKATFILISVATILISYSLYINQYYGSDILLILRHALFQVVSTITSTGFSSTSIDPWPGVTYIILMILMFTGASMSSTTGGIKLYNVVIVLKGIWWEIQAMILPKNTIMPHKIYHDKYKEVSNRELIQVLLFVLAYILVFMSSVVVVAFYSTNMFNVIITVASAMGNTGLGPTFISTTSPLVVKLVLIFDFWVGRIAVWPVLLVIVYVIKITTDNFNEKLK